MKKKHTQKYTPLSNVVTGIFVLLCIVWVMPIFEVITNSFKSNASINTNAFSLPSAESFVGWANYIKGMTFGNYPFMKSVGYSFWITIASVFLILLFTSMTAWYIARVNSKFANGFYYLCLFSMIVPFQMVMFTLTFTADNLKLNTPWTIPIVYLGFGAGLAIFMFVGFVKGLPADRGPRTPRRAGTTVAPSAPRRSNGVRPIRVHGRPPTPVRRRRRECATYAPRPRRLAVGRNRSAS